MWLVTKFGFYSVVAHNSDPDLMLVRGRCQADMEQLRGFAQGRGLNLPEIVTNAGYDYGFRMFVPRRDWEKVGAALTAEIDYPNFKNQAHGDPDRDAAYMQMWTIMRNFQDKKLDRGGQSYYCRRHKYNPPANSGFAFCPQCEIVDYLDDEYDE